MKSSRRIGSSRCTFFQSEIVNFRTLAAQPHSVAALAAIHWQRSARQTAGGRQVLLQLISCKAPRIDCENPLFDGGAESIVRWQILFPKSFVYGECHLLGRIGRKRRDFAEHQRYPYKLSRIIIRRFGLSQSLLQFFCERRLSDRLARQQLIPLSIDSILW